MRGKPQEKTPTPDVSDQRPPGASAEAFSVELWGALAGTVKVSRGTDLSQPTGETCEADC